jgi:methylated-DNA-protein-cysteine methyltransferase-like protein
MEIFTQKVIEVIKSIPLGNVASYGQIAYLSGNPRAARQVSRILHSMSQKYDLPWHRIVNAKGEIAFKDNYQLNIQKQLLEEEGIKFDQFGRIKEEYFYK